MLKSSLPALIALGLVMPLATFAYSPESQIAKTKQAADIIFVAPLGNDSGNGTQSQPLRTITAALQRARSGTIVQLGQGVYNQETGENFPLQLPRGVILRGDTASNGANIVISGGGNFRSPSFASQNITILVNNEARVEGVTITNANPRGYAIWLESAQGARIVSNTFANNVHDGVFMTGNTRSDIVDNIFRGNGANGLSAVGSSSGTVAGNTFDNNGFGIVISQRSSIAVSNNRITNNRGGLVINNLSTPTLRNNLIANTREIGIAILRDRNGHPVVDMGTPESLGLNTFENNSTDINNATGAVLVAVGNRIDRTKVVGAVELAPAGNEPQRLSDVGGHWAETQITALANRNIIRGFNDGSFRPQEPVTRAQFAAILASAFPQKATVRPPRAFADVPDTFWGQRAIAQSFAQGFMSGFPAGEFRPAQQIPRVQVLVALVSGMNFSGGDPARLRESFTDASDIPNFALNAIAAAQQNRLIVNHPNPNLLEPNRLATRAEVAAMVHQVLVRQGMIQ